MSKDQEKEYKTNFDFDEDTLNCEDQNSSFNEDSENPKAKTKKKSTSKKIVSALLAAATGLSGVVISSAVIAYDAMFPRLEKPDYSIYAGEYVFDRVKNKIAREELSFKSQKNTLAGYFYKAEFSKGLVVVTHGYNAGADDYLPIILYLNSNNYSVFAFDCTGVYNSEGENRVGWCQPLIDLDNALDFVKEKNLSDGKPLFLLGHSLGGYASASALEIHKNINACALIAPLYSGYTIMTEQGERYAGKIASIPKPVFNTYQKILFKEYTNYNAVRGINSVNIPVIVAHGIDDKTITYDKQSITAHKDEITNPNVTFIDCYGLFGGHNNIWHSLNSVVYQEETKSRLRQLKILNNGENLSYNQQVDFFKTIDHALFSEVNPDLMGKIVETFDKTL